MVCVCCTPRSVRVVQSEEFEDFNMVNVKWVYTIDSKCVGRRLSPQPDAPSDDALR